MDIEIILSYLPKEEALREMIMTNNKQIYQAPMIRRYEINAKNAVEGLFEAFYDMLKHPEKKNKSKHAQNFNKFILEKEYKPEEPIEQIVTDYIAGMTDVYAVNLYNELFIPKGWKL